MSATVQLIAAASAVVLPLLATATHFGAALGRHEADLQHAAAKARLDEQRTAARERARPRPSWPDVYAPLLPTTVPARPLPDVPTPLTTAQPGHGPGRHRKG